MKCWSSWDCWLRVEQRLESDAYSAGGNAGEWLGEEGYFAGLPIGRHSGSTHAEDARARQLERN